MKIFPLVAACLLITPAFAQSLSDAPDIMHFNGAIKNADVRTLDASGNSVGGHKDINCYTQEDGRKTRPVKGVTHHYMLTGYNEEGKELSETSHMWHEGARYPVEMYSDNALHSKNISMTGGRNPEWHSFVNEQNEIVKLKENVYDANHRLILTNIYDQDSVLQQFVRYEYADGAGTIYTETGGGMLLTQSDITLDEQGNPLKVSTFSSETNASVTTEYKYTYDNQGNFTRADAYVNGTKQESIIRDITYR